MIPRDATGAPDWALLAKDETLLNTIKDAVMTAIKE